jgi:hypothetical protein
MEITDVKSFITLDPGRSFPEMCPGEERHHPVVDPGRIRNREF